MEKFKNRTNLLHCIRIKTHIPISVLMWKWVYIVDFSLITVRNISFLIQFGEMLMAECSRTLLQFNEAHFPLTYRLMRRNFNIWKRFNEIFFYCLFHSTSPWNALIFCEIFILMVLYFTIHFKHTWVQIGYRKIILFLIKCCNTQNYCQNKQTVSFIHPFTDECGVDIKKNN